MGQTIVEKIAQAENDRRSQRPLRAGDFLSIRPHRVMTHDNTSAVMKKFKAIGAQRVYDPQQLVFTCDHDIQNTTPPTWRNMHPMEKFARQQGIDFYRSGMRHWPPDHGGARLCAARHVRRRLRFALQYVRRAGSDWNAGSAHRCRSHLGNGRILVAGSAHSSGRAGPATSDAEVTGKDVIITLCGLYNHEEVLNAAVEFMQDPG